MKKNILLLTIFLVATPGCQQAYYKTMEGFGVHKRDILVDRVEDARDAQEQTKEQFASALEKFTEVANFKGGDLDAKYKQLKHEFDVSTSKAKTMRSRIDKVEEVAEALFEESEAPLHKLCGEWGVDYFVFPRGTYAHKGTTSWRYITDNLNAGEETVAYKLEGRDRGERFSFRFADKDFKGVITTEALESSLKHFKLVYENRAFRVFRVIKGG